MSHVQQVLAKNGRGRKFRQAVEHGWASRKAHPGNAAWIRKTTRAHVVWEGTIKKAEELLLDDDDGVEVCPHCDTISFICDDAVLVRIKKADASLRSSNVKTALSDLFDDHEADLFGYNGLQRVQIVYVLNRFETDIEWIGVVAHDKGEYLWHFELDAPASGAEIVAFVPKSPPQGDTAGLAKVRQPAGNSEQEKKDGASKEDGD